MTVALEIQNLRKVYSGGTVALDGIDLKVPEGEFYGLLGPNGAGKTTTIGIICSLVKKTEGRVRVFDHDIDVNHRAAKRLLGVVPQEFNFNIFEGVEQIILQQAGFYGIPAGQARANAEKYLKLLGLWQKRDEPARNLSGGMKRRLMIVRALVHEPEVLILDEPTAGVDIELRRSMWDFLIELNASGKTIILTTHYLEEAEHLCRRIGIIDDGRIIEDTATRELVARLETETFVIDLDSSDETAPDLQDFAVRMIEPGRLEVDVTRGQSLNSLFARLEARGLQVNSMRNKTNRLEELFVKLTA